MSEKLYCCRAIQGLKEGNKIISENEEKAEIFKTFFTSGFTRESVTLPELTTTSESNITKFSIKDFFSKCDQIRRKLQISSHLLKKLLVENFIFFAVLPTKIRKKLKLLFNPYKSPGVLIFVDHT